MKIGLLLISTGKYDQFVQPLIDSVKNYFMKKHEVIVYLFTDKLQDLIGDERVSIEQFIIAPLKFPFATLYRYKIFNELKDEIKTDFVFYSDADMRFVGDVEEYILPNESGLTAVQHPGFWKGGWGSSGTHELSMAYLPIKKRKNYYCGGFQGGKREVYLSMSEELYKNIEIDLKKAKEINYTHNSGILAEWHDETHYNWYMSSRCPKVLSPSYCFPENWKSLPFEPKILALEKNHNEIRSW
jgi:histo-blood group ABO system transferase